MIMHGLMRATAPDGARRRAPTAPLPPQQMLTCSRVMRKPYIDTNIDSKANTDTIINNADLQIQIHII